MTQTTAISIQARPPWVPVVLACAIAANIFSIVVVNFWIYYARAVFIATHPEYVAIQPPTISRAISDPAIGEPFAIWITITAVFLVLGVVGISVVFAPLSRSLPMLTGCRGRIVFTCVLLYPVFQGCASVGMYLLSTNRFPDGTDMHMTGSYMFFIAETLVTLNGVVLLAALLSCRATMALLADAGHFRRRWVQVRTWIGVISVASAAVYLGLFLIKRVDLGTANETLYLAYVLLEPAVISSFLLFHALFQLDLWAVMRNRRIA